MLRIIRSSYFFYSLLFIIGVFSRFPFIEKAQSHWDGPDYTIGILHYSLLEKTPSPPGYPLYIALGKLFHFFISDPHLSILLVSVLFAGIGAVVFYIAGKLFFDRTVGLISASIFLSAPTIYYFGITANPYGILPTTSVLVALVTFLIIKDKSDFGFLLSLVFSFAIGIRPQDAMFLTPLYLLGCFYLKRQERIVSVASMIFLTLFWLLPTTVAVGGLGQYFSYIYSFAKNDASPNLSLQRVYMILPTIIKGLYLTCGFASIFLLLMFKYTPYISQPIKLMNKNVKPYFLVFAFWILPSLLFNVFIRSDHAAHQMTYLSACILLSSYFIKKVFRKYTLIIVLLLIVINLMTFFRDRDPGNYTPYVSQSFHYSEITKNNLRMDALEKFVKKNFKGQETLIIVDPEIFRATSYHLKNYKVISFGALDTNTSPNSEIMHVSLNWHYLKVSNLTHLYSIPKDIKYILLYNNDRPITFDLFGVTALKLTGNQDIYQIKVSADEILKLSKGRISLAN